tara:strand:- start:117 stop:698 length:582 start_codon:yes stop_codon:yes gene_type:complete
MIKKVIILLSILAPFISYFFYIKLTKIKNKKYPLKLLSLISVALIVLSLGYLRFDSNYSPDLTKPNISLKPIEVLTIQLNSLQRNNIPFNDAGIEQVWEFAHPNNKKITGPLEKFKKMIYSENYKMLIKHENSEITILSENNNVSIYKVNILSDNKKKYSYIWQIEKVEQEGELKNCWMTTSVSNPEYLGDVI